MHRLKQPVLSALLILTILTCLGMTPLLAGETALVIAKDYGFEPAEITVKAGATVRWENQDKRQYHSVFFEQFGDKPGDYFFPGEFRERTFDLPGTYPYICEPHWQSHGMKGVVIVE